MTLIPYVHRDISDRVKYGGIEQVQGFVHSRSFEDLQGILLFEEEIRAAVADLGRVITDHYQRFYENPDEPELVVVTVLEGAKIFAADLVRKIRIPMKHDAFQVGSYGDGEVSTGEYHLKKDLSKSIRGKRVLLVEDIVDSGGTMEYMLGYFSGKNPLDIKVVTLCDKPSRRRIERDGKISLEHYRSDFTGFIIPDAFIVGYGLDFAERFREMPFIGVKRN